MGQSYVDSRLIDLAGQDPGQYGFAADLARIQQGNAQLRGHHLAYNDEFVWRRIKGHRGNLRGLRLNIRCVSCGCVASLREWYVASTLPQLHADSLRASILETRDPETLRFLLNCDGPEISADLVSGLIDMAINANEWETVDAQA